MARTASARLIIVNAQPTPFDDVAELTLHDPIGEVLPTLCGGATRGA
jgi:NAD-dependent deacetylase